MSAASCQIEDAAAPAPAAIDLGQSLAEGQDAVVAVEVEGVDGLGVADGAVVRVVEQQREARRRRGARAPTRPTSAGSFHSCTMTRSAPSQSRRRIGVRARRSWSSAPDRRARYGVEPRLAVVGEQVAQAPGARGS